METYKLGECRHENTYKGAQGVLTCSDCGAPCVCTSTTGITMPPLCPIHKLPPLKEIVLPCPFCGGEPIKTSAVADGGEARFFVTCRSCACQGPWAKTLGNALKYWNMRKG